MICITYLWIFLVIWGMVYYWIPYTSNNDILVLLIDWMITYHV
jgi:hypothetical protein